MTQTEKDKGTFEVVGGQMNFKQLNTGTESKVYAIGKAFIWLDMIKKGRRPKKWNKPNKKGTKMTFSIIRDVEIREAAFKELEAYLNQIDEEFGTDISLDREEP